MIPFLASIAEVDKARFILDSGFWGKFGHSGSIPYAAVIPWLRAAFLSPTVEVESLLDSYHAILPSSKVDNQFIKKDNLIDSTDLKMADLLKNYVLG